MTRGKRLTCPQIMIVQACQPKYTTLDDAWAVVGPAIARILAQTIVQKKAAKDATQKKSTSGQ